MTSAAEILDADLCEEHASEAAFLWHRRDIAVRDMAYDAEGLAELDERLSAHLDGLRLSIEVGARASMTEIEDTAGAGEAFVASVLSLERWDLPAFASILDLAGGSPAARGIVSALGWMPVDLTRALLPGLLADGCPPALQRIGIAASAVQREDVGPALGYALESPDPALRSRAIKAAGELGRRDLLPEVRDHGRGADTTAAFWALWSSMLLGDKSAPEALWTMAVSHAPMAERAAEMAMRRIDPKQGASWLTTLAAEEGGERIALAGAASLGNPTLIPYLLDAMERPESARRAAFALTMVTGAEIADSPLEGKAPKGFKQGPSDDPDDDDTAMDPDEGLPWPNVPLVRRWWSREGARYQPGGRYFLGKPMSKEGLETALRTARQPVRAAAAIELVLGGHRRLLPEVRARVG